MAMSIGFEGCSDSEGACFVQAQMSDVELRTAIGGPVGRDAFGAHVYCRPRTSPLKRVAHVLPPGA
jgi:hypothetical protein